MKAINDWVLIQRDSKLPGSDDDHIPNVLTGLVQSVGEGKRSETTGSIIPITTPAVGDHVAYSKFGLDRINGLDAVAAGTIIAVDVEQKGS